MVKVKKLVKELLFQYSKDTGASVLYIDFQMYLVNGVDQTIIVQ